MADFSREQHDGVPSETAVDIPNLKKNSPGEKGMILPFEPLALTFHDVNYYVDMPAVSLQKISAPIPESNIASFDLLVYAFK